MALISMSKTIRNNSRLWGTPHQIGQMRLIDPQDESNLYLELSAGFLDDLINCKSEQHQSEIYNFRVDNSRWIKRLL